MASGAPLSPLLLRAVRRRRDIGQAAGDALGGRPRLYLCLLGASVAGEGQRYEPISAATAAAQKRNVWDPLGHLPALATAVAVLPNRGDHALQSWASSVASRTDEAVPQTAHETRRLRADDPSARYGQLVRQEPKPSQAAATSAAEV
jgi:hypothetical protein